MTPEIKAELAALAAIREWDTAFNPNRGMSLRDYFAGKALQGIASTDASTRYAFEDGYWSDAATRSYAAADAMIAQRNKS
jgi:hypothetical protein